MSYILPQAAPVRWARFECKYLLSERVAQEVRRWIDPYVEPDPFAARSPTHSYPISSLYMDTPGLRLFQETIDGCMRREKLRIRSYSRAVDAPFFLEIKRRIDQVVEKSRVRVTRAVVADVLAGEPPSSAELGLRGAEFEAYEAFVGLALRLGVRPCVHVGYVRQAYAALYQHDVRVTFDRDVIYSSPQEQDALVRGPNTHDVENTRVVLELKFNSTFPAWMQDLVHALDLHRISYSKYGQSVATSGTRLPGLMPLTSHGDKR